MSARAVPASRAPAPPAHRQVAARYPVMPALRERWSPRSFTEREPDAALLCSLVEAARLAPSAHNSQPSRFIIGRRGRGATYQRLFDCLDDHNREWAHGAPVLMLAAVSRQRFSQVTGEFVPYSHCLHDLGLAVMSLVVEAQDRGLHSHLLAAFDPERAQAEFAIPPLFLPGLMIALGYPGRAEALPPDLYAKETAPRTRRAPEEIAFEENWGQASSIFTENPGSRQR